MRKTTYTFLFLLIAFSQNAFPQKIIRQSLSCLGSSYSSNKLLIQQTVGQPSNTTVLYEGKGCVRQGFLQPLSSTIADLSTHNTINLSIFPNPVNENFTIAISGSDKTFNFKVTDLFGRSLITSEITENQEKIISSNGWNKGIYFIIIYSDKRLETIKKIIKN